MAGITFNDPNNSNQGSFSYGSTPSLNALGGTAPAPTTFTPPPSGTIGGSTTGPYTSPTTAPTTSPTAPATTSTGPTMTKDPTTGQAVWTMPGQTAGTGTTGTSGTGTGYQAPNYPTLNPAAPTRYLYINGVLHDRYDASSPYYLSPQAYPGLPESTTQYSAPWQSSQPYTPSYASPAGTGQIAAGYQAPPWALPSYDPIVQAQQSGIPLSQAYGNYLNGLGNGNYVPTSGGTQQQAQSSTPQNNSYLQQLLSSLFGSSQPQYSTVKTPLGYTQYQSNVPQGTNSQGLDPMTQIILAMLMGGNSQGGSQNSFWSLLGA